MKAEPEPEPDPDPECEPERAQHLAVLSGDRGLQLVEDEMTLDDATGDLASLMREQEEAAARLAVDVGGVHLTVDDCDLSGSDDNEDESELGISEEPEGLTEQEKTEAENLVTQVATLDLSDEERIQIAGDCRSACARAFVDVAFTQLTMVKVCTAIELSDGDTAFFSDAGLDDERDAAWETSSKIPLAQLAPSKRFGVMFVLVGVFTCEGRYDARHRAFLRRLAEVYQLEWPKIRLAETMHLKQMVVRKSQEATAEHEQESGNWGRALKVGGAAVLGGAAMFLTAGAAAPAVAGVFGMIGLGGVLSAVGGAGFVSVMFGAAGAGLGGYKVARRTGDVAEFAFVPILACGSRKTTPSSAADLHGSVEYVMATLSMVTRQVSCRKVGNSQEEAMLAWEARNMVDAHLLCMVEPSGSWKELKNNVTLDSALDHLKQEMTRAVNWERQKRQRAVAGWVDPTGQPRFNDGQQLVGCRVFVEHKGEGSVITFKKSTFGTSEHIIKFDNMMAGKGEGVKLRRKGNSEKRWLVQVDPTGTAKKVDVSSDKTVEMGETGSSGDSVGMTVTIGVSGWLKDSQDSFQTHWQFLQWHMAGSEAHALKWETDLMVALGKCFEDMVKGYLKGQVGKLVAVRVGLGATVTALALPAMLYSAAGAIDNPWSLSMARADKAGRILANLLLRREHGHRPVILLGWSAGARMIFTCLEILAAAPDGAGQGIVDSAFLLGCPVEADEQRWAAARSIVADRLVNGYAPGDWLLSLVSRASLNVSSIAGLTPIPHSSIENVHVGAYLGAKGHLKYRTRARRIFEALGVSGSGIAGGHDGA